jgi:hypothetical protein
VPWLGLYPGTLGLLIAFVYSEPTMARRGPRLTVASALLVAIAAGVDIHLARTYRIGNFHQVLTAFAIGIWAWRLRDNHFVSSIIVATYGAVQLPFQSMMNSLIVSDSARTAFLNTTKLSYVMLKLPLLVAIYPFFRGASQADALPLPVVPVEAHDVLVSYARADESRAQALVDALREAQLTVWWDRMIPAGHSWRGTIESALRTARCVVVLWSPHSVQSRYVLEEGASAYARSIMISVVIDASIPFGFREAQAVMMTDAADAGALDRLKTEIRRILDAPGPGEPGT